MKFNREQVNFFRLYVAMLLGLAFLVTMGAARSAEVIVRATLPDTYCDGSAIVDAFESIEVYSDASPIPHDDTLNCLPASISAPTGYTPVSVPNPGVANDSLDVVLDLTPGVTYYFRARVKVNGMWSSLSSEISKLIPVPMPGVPTIIIIEL